MEEFINKLMTEMQTGEFSLIFLAAAFLGGVIASLGPCSLGILPIIAAYIGGYGTKDHEINCKTEKNGAFMELSANLRNFAQLLSFVLGLSVVLTVIGIACALTGRVFMSIGGPYWILIIASLLLVMGLNLEGVLDLTLPVIVKKIPKSKGQSLFLYPFIVGALFAFAATPCSTPILAGIMSFATLSQNMLYAALMLFLFALGQGLIIVLIGISTSFLKNMKRFTFAGEILLKISGVLLILSSIFLYIKIFSRFF